MCQPAAEDFLEDGRTAAHSCLSPPPGTQSKNSFRQLPVDCRPERRERSGERNVNCFPTEMNGVIELHTRLNNAHTHSYPKLGFEPQVLRRRFGLAAQRDDGKRSGNFIRPKLNQPLSGCCSAFTPSLANEAAFDSRRLVGRSGARSRPRGSAQSLTAPHGRLGECCRCGARMAALYQ